MLTRLIHMFLWSQLSLKSYWHYFFGILQVTVSLPLTQNRTELTFRMSWGNVDQSQAPEREQEVEEVKSKSREACNFQCKSTIVKGVRLKNKMSIFYERTELHGSVLQWGLDGHGWVLHCSRSGGLSWISQLRSLKRSPFGRWHTTSLVFIPPPHGLVH